MREEKEEYETREKAIMDHISFIKDGQDLVREEGRKEGVLLHLISLVRKKAEYGQEIEAIAKDLIEEPELIRKIDSLIKQNPNSKGEDIYNRL